MSKCYHIALATILVVYFIFASGIPFELAGLPDIARFEAPYNVALSDHRLDLSGHYTQDDEAVRAWLEQSEINPVYSGYYGLLFLQEHLAYDKDIYFIPENMELPVGSYVFLRSWTNTSQELCFWTGSGTRKSVPFFGFEGETVYQSGNSKIMEVK